MHTATALANPNIAFIKYWGNKNQALRIPVSGSISMNLAGLETRTRVNFDPQLRADTLNINTRQITGPGLERVAAFLQHVRRLAGIETHAQVVSTNNFPIGAGIASSASAFAALSLAATRAAGLVLDEISLSRLARLGSGSACRSIPAGYVEWLPGTSDDDSYACSIASPEYWNLVDCIAVITTEHKSTGSTRGHELAGTSPLQNARVFDASRRLDACRTAILNRDFEAFASVTELDSNLMHAVMMTSTPILLYWKPATLEIMHRVTAWRAQGLPVCYTIDAGPNVHVLSLSEYAAEISGKLGEIPGVKQVLQASAGGSTRLVTFPG